MTPPGGLGTNILFGVPRITANLNKNLEKYKEEKIWNRYLMKSSVGL